MSEQAKYPPYDDRSFPDPRGLRDEVGTWEGKKALSLMNIDISLRRVADSIDIRKELDAKTEECKKLNEELARLRVNCDMYADARDKAIEIKKMLTDGVKLYQRDIAAANQCIEDIAKIVIPNEKYLGSSYKPLCDIIRAYREKKENK